MRTSPITLLKDAQVTSRSTLLALAAGSVIGLVQTVTALSLASLVFSGPLAADLPRGVSMLLATTGISAILMAFLSASKGVIATAQSSPIVVIAVAISAITMPLAASPALLPTTLMLIVLSTLATGIILTLIGRFNLSGLVRYLPYPVMGGFIAGAGLLLLQGAIGIMADNPLSLAALPALFTIDQLGLWLPGVLFGMLMFAAMKRWPHLATLPVVLFAGTALFFGLLWLNNMTFDDAAAQGLLLSISNASVEWSLLVPIDFQNIDWAFVWGHLAEVGVVLVLVPIVLLLNISGIELLDREDLELNHELRSAGMVNIISAFTGGMIAFHSLSMTTLSHRMGAYNRQVGVIVGLVHLLFLFVGITILAYVPVFVMGGMLFYLGLNFCHEWMIEKRPLLSRIDYAVVLFIGVTILLAGFLTGIVFGLAIMVLIFVITYSRTNIFYRNVSGVDISSNVERPVYHEQRLESLKKSIYVLQLQGYIFFGTANIILNQTRSQIDSKQHFGFLILDFQRVMGLDSSALFSLDKLKHLAITHKFVLIFTHLSEPVQREFELNNLKPDEHLQFFPDLDHAMEWCEERLLLLHNVTQQHLPLTLSIQLGDAGFRKEWTQRLKQYLEEIIFDEGEYLMRQDDAESENAMYFIEIGAVSIYLDGENGTRKRLHTQKMGTVVGEVGFFLNSPRSASVIAEMKTRAYRLTRTQFEAMKTSDPELAIAFNELMVRMIAERLVKTNRELLTLVD